jgi:hypothetical protein
MAPGAAAWTPDHLVIVAATLAEGQAMVEGALGVAMEPGGQHPLMGTHNALLSLGPHSYLEVIAPDPALPAPPRPRWFAMDDHRGAPRLATWVAAVPDLDAALIAAPPGAGIATALSRGPYRWRIGIPADGRQPFDGLFPALIAWDGLAHPAPALPDRGLRLAALTLTHPQAPALAAALAPLADPRITAIPGATPALAARFETPAGLRAL